MQRELRYGGKLQIGDFIIVSNGNFLDFGWYCGDGINRTLQYYNFRSPGGTFSDYIHWENTPIENRSNWQSRKYKNGFNIKCLWKSYINTVHKTRVAKIVNPEELFTEAEDIEYYEKSKEALIKLNFIKNY